MMGMRTSVIRPFLTVTVAATMFVVAGLSAEQSTSTAPSRATTAALGETLPIDPAITSGRLAM